MFPRRGYRWDIHKLASGIDGATLVNMFSSLHFSYFGSNAIKKAQRGEKKRSNSGGEEGDWCGMHALELEILVGNSEGDRRDADGTGSRSDSPEEVQGEMMEMVEFFLIPMN